MRPKDIGTRAESGALRAIRKTFPAAERLTLSGSADRGDIGGCGDFIFEVKGGAQSAAPSSAQVDAWMGEATVEAKNAGVKHGILVLQRPGYSPNRSERWWAYISVNALSQVLGSEFYTNAFLPVRFELGDLLFILDANNR